MMAAAEASVAKKELEEQLKEIKEQNSQLKDNYRLLNELYESAIRDAVENSREARHNKIFGWDFFWHWYFDRNCLASYFRSNV